jgi:tRNA pseudouridine38-40 synthase
MTRNIKLVIAYDGSDFHGWQAQPGQPTIQGILADLLEQITGAKPAVHGAGRTDSGVHAWGQVANFKTESAHPAREFARALNALLPPSIRIRHAQEVSAEFHARRLVTAKTYHYRIYRGPVVPPTLWRHVLHVPRRLDFTAMAQAARHFEGEHDFTSFAASTGSEEQDRARTMVRNIVLSQMCVGTNGAEENDPNAAAEWLYVIRGRSFLRNMVRKIVGTLLEVGRGRISPAEIAGLFELRDRTRSGPTAPAHGLSLMSVEYAAEYPPPDFEY